MDGQTQKGLSFMSLKYVGPNFLYIVGQKAKNALTFSDSKGSSFLLLIHSLDNCELLFFHLAFGKELWIP